MLVVDATGPYSVVKAVITSESNDGECCEVQLGCATSWAVCWRGDGLAAAVALTDDGAAEGEPRHRCVFVAKSGGGYFCVDTKAVECAAGRRRKRVVGAAFADDGALAVAFDDGTLRVAKYKVDRGRVVEALSCACDAEGGDATALAVCGGDRFVVGYGDGGCAVFRAEFCDVMETAAVSKLMDLPPLAGAGAVTALAGCAHWLFVASEGGLRWWDAPTGSPLASFRLESPPAGVAIVRGGAGDDWALAAALDGGVARLAYDADGGLRVSDVAGVGAALGVCAGPVPDAAPPALAVAAAPKTWFAFRGDAATRVTLENGVAAPKPRVSEAFDAVDLREDDEAALANALHALAGGGPAAIPAAAVVAKVFAEATCEEEDVVAAAGVVCGWPFGSDAGAEAALRAALRGLGLRDGGSRDARRALEAALERLDVFRELLASMDARGRGLQDADGAWARAWARFRVGDAFEYALKAAEAGAVDAVVALWRRTRLDDAARAGRGAVARARADDRVLACVAALPGDADPELYVAWLAREVAPTLRGAAPARLRAWATDAARGLEARGRLDDALRVAGAVLRALEGPHAVGALASGTRGDVWLADLDRVVATDDDQPNRPKDELRALYGTLRHVLSLRDDHGVASTLDSYESADKAAIARALLDQVEDPAELGKEIDAHVRPICGEHGVDCDALLLDYARACARAFAVARATEKKRRSGGRGEAADATDAQLARALAVREEIVDDAKRQLGALEVLERARPPYGAAVVALATDVGDDDGGDEDRLDPAERDVATRLRDAARLVTLTHLAHKHRVANFDAGDAGHALFLLDRVVDGSWRLSGLDPRDVLEDARTLARAYPATLSLRGAVVAFVQNLSCPEFGDADLGDLDALADAARAALCKHAAMGSERQSARREVLAYFTATLDDAEAPRSERRCCAVLGASIAADVVADNDGAGEDGAFRAGDVALLRELESVVRLQGDWGLWAASPATLRDDALRDKLLAAAAAPVLAADPGPEALAHLDGVAALLGAPEGWAHAQVALAHCGDDAHVDRAAAAADAAAAAGAAPDLLRHLGYGLVERNRSSLDLSSAVGDRRRAAAMRAFARAATAERAPGAAVEKDALALESLAFVGAVRSRCVGAPGARDQGRGDDGLLLRPDQATAPVAAFAAAVAAALRSGDAAAVAAAADGVVDVLRANAAWRLASACLCLRDAVCGACGSEAQWHSARPQAYALEQLRSLLHSDPKTCAGHGELCVALALAAPPAQAFEAYRDAVGACGGSARELARLGHLAEVGEALAARLEDGHLEHASRSLAVDARWWKFLRERGVRFDHARLCLQASPTTCDVGAILRRSRAHATELLPAVLDAHGGAPLDGETIGAVLELCGRYGVDDDVAGSAIATRVLARGVAGGESLDVAAREALDLVRDDDARRRVLRAALATADGAAYDRVDLALRLLLEAGDDDEAVSRSPLAPVDANASKEATLLASCVHAAPRDAADAPSFAAPSRATLTKWRRCAAWLKAVEDDARTQLGARGAAALGDRKLSFHDVVARPKEALSDLLSEASCPHLSVVCSMVDGLPPGSLWVALADKAASKPRPGSKEEAFFYRCLDRAGNASLAFRRSAQLADAFAADLAASPSAAAGLGELRATREAAKHASAWADGAPREPAALEARVDARQRADAAARRAAAVLFGAPGAAVDGDGGAVPAAGGAAALLRRLYEAAASAAAAAALAAPAKSAREPGGDAFAAAARRAHGAAEVLAAREAEPGAAEVARRELARRWLFDEDDDDDDDDDGEAPTTVFAPSPLEKRDLRLATAALKVAFVLSARDGGAADDGAGDAAALQRALARGFDAAPRARTEGASAVALLVELAAATGGPGDEAAAPALADARGAAADEAAALDGALRGAARAEAGRRCRLTARVRLRALRAAAVLARGDGDALAAAWARAAARGHGDGGDGPPTLLALSRRLRVVAELAALRLPHARVVAGRGVGCGVGVDAFVETLLRDGGRDARLAPTLLPLLAAVLAEADDDDAAAPGADAAADARDGARAPLWASLLGALADAGQWRPLLAVLQRLAPRAWLRSAAGDAVGRVFRAAVLRPILELEEAPQPDSDAVAAVLDDVVALARACPHFLDGDHHDVHTKIRRALAARDREQDLTAAARAPPAQTPKKRRARRLSL